MNLDEFLYNLHYEPQKVSPLNWIVNWADAPLPYKLYRGLPVIPLSFDIPLNFIQKEAGLKPSLKEIGHCLWYTFGLTQVSRQMNFTLPPVYRRFTPSGGALYPSELYIYLKIEDIPKGIYHYDVTNHQLVLLREGNFDSYITRALGNRCDISSTFATIFISTFFWKNFFKYHNFSYRLQGLDAGFVIGQLQEVGKSFGFEMGVYYLFLDKAVNHLLGLYQQEESVYGIIPLSIETKTKWFSNQNVEALPSAAQLCKEIPPLKHQHYVRSKEIREYPMLIKMNEACMMNSFHVFHHIKQEKEKELTLPSILLPYVNKLSYNLAPACRNRYSPGMDFVLKPITQDVLSTLLMTVTSAFSYRNDIDEGFLGHPKRISLYGCYYNIKGIPKGVYYYDSSIHALKVIRRGDFRSSLQFGLLANFVNMSQVSLGFNVVGHKDHYQGAFGYRGHRMQQMEAGILSHKLLLVAAALNMGGHPILGFNVNHSDQLYEIRGEGKTSLLQIPMGHFRPNPRLQGSLHH
ncbi:NADH oxidase [Bacillus wiedmannii]|uniref:SagB family peptide dehydrogenase n=1 Tax=Bacillus wiedmannii TaxID=1890302 RepID=UPI000BF31A87|nr:SagB family peptide dehydrogenase [Bacillus wiedmannii]PFX61602.1 NADH oxidase [Bacillus wiedmannii]